jgi:transcriptional regulator with XRE-family HTH domain
MSLNQKIALARNQKGLTQEELATMSNVTVRTIQRIESGNSVPRSFTLKLIASALDIPFEELYVTENVAVPQLAPAASSTYHEEDTIHFLRLLCLSCFSYLLIPYVHFLIPVYLLKQRQKQNLKALRFAHKVIRSQVYWVVLTNVVFLLLLAYNFISATYFNKQYMASYLVAFFVMYFLNGVFIAKSFFTIKVAIRS